MSTEEENREFRGQLRQAWFDTSLERDRSILMLSSGAVGVLFVIVDKFPLATPLALLLFLGALLSFIISIVAAVWVFQENRTILRGQLKGDLGVDRFAAILDVFMIAGFVIGLLLSSTLATLYAVDSYCVHKMKENPAMSDEAKRENTSLNESLKGISEIRPGGQDNLTASFQKVNEIAPPPPPPPPPPPAKKE